MNPTKNHKVAGSIPGLGTSVWLGNGPRKGKKTRGEKKEKKRFFWSAFGALYLFLSRPSLCAVCRPSLSNISPVESFACTGRTWHCWAFLTPRRTPATWLDCIFSLVWCFWSGCLALVLPRFPVQGQSRSQLPSPAPRWTIFGLVHLRLGDREWHHLPRKHRSCNPIMENNTNMRRCEINKKQGPMHCWLNFVV